MSEPRRTPVSEPANDSQIRRAQRGVVAGYIHQLSERHGNHRSPELNAQPSPKPGEGG
ncbi:MAG TPA: hypothetical protein VKA47_10920 [Solirubrobacterales bacterium]|nr:hypothetical protein [Solirubrobacterales bacterium]